MTNAWPGEDLEAMDGLGDEESTEDSFESDVESFYPEGYDDAEASAAERRRRDRRRKAVAQRELARRRELARQRGALARARSGRPPAGRGAPTSTKAAVRNTQAAVRNLDLESKVQADALRSALAAQARRTSRAEMATVASVVANQVQNTFQNRFELLRNPIAQAAISFAPLMFLSPAKQGSGPGAYTRDPRLWGGAAIAGIIAVDKLTQPKATLVNRINVFVDPTMVVEATQTAIADAVDDKGRTIANKVFTWSSSNDAVASVDSSSGLVTAHRTTGSTFISATVDGVTQRERVSVVGEPEIEGNGLVPGPLADQAAEATVKAAAAPRRRPGQAKGAS